MMLRGNRCRCPTCGEHFNSVTGFDAHLVGNWKDRGASRRCLTVGEMLSRGMSQMPGGWWITETREQRQNRGGGGGAPDSSRLRASRPIG
jgi:hypothetical protein